MVTTEHWVHLKCISNHNARHTNTQNIISAASCLHPSQSLFLHCILWIKINSLLPNCKHVALSISLICINGRVKNAWCPEVHPPEHDAFWSTCLQFTINVLSTTYSYTIINLVSSEWRVLLVSYSGLVFSRRFGFSPGSENPDISIRCREILIFRTSINRNHDVFPLPRFRSSFILVNPVVSISICAPRI